MHIREQKGSSLLELVFVVLIITTLMIFAINRIQTLLVDVEKVSILRVTGALNSAINLQAAEIVVDQGVEAIRVLEHTNPMKFLTELPHNYIGLRSDNQADQLGTSNWYFDNKERILGYTVNNKQHFESSLKGVPRARFRVVLVYREGNQSDENKKIQGIVLKSLDEYRWK